MPADILLNNNAQYWDISFTDGDFTLTYGFETALLMSLFCEKRASKSEVPNLALRRGWWGNTVGDWDNYEIGSKLWLLDQARSNPASLNLAKTYSADGLSWLLTDSYCTKIDIDTSYTINNMNIDITLYRSNDQTINNSYKLWNNTNALS
jgi:phage gp46-like protein